MRYVECVPDLDEVDKAVMRASVRWGTAGFAEEEHTVQETRETGGTKAAGERFGVLSFQTVLGTVKVVGASSAVHPFTAEQPRSSHWFHIHRFSGSLH